MKIISVQSLVAMMALISITAFAATPGKPPTASAFAIHPDGKIEILDSALVKADKAFGFNWTDHNDTSSDKKMLNTIENLLAKTRDFSRLTEQDLQSMGRLLSRLGAYYVHAQHNPTLAIAKMNLATPLLKNNEDKMWNYNNLAYAYELRYAGKATQADEKISLYYLNKVITTAPKENNQVVAYAYCIKGELAWVENKTSDAEANFNKAFSIYKRINNDAMILYGKARNLIESLNGTNVSDVNRMINEIVDSFHPTSTAHDYCDHIS